MPIYEYRCKKCGAHLEAFLKLSDKQPTRCRKCGGRLEKLISTSAIQFKGEGWYVTDYARKGKSSGDAGESKDAGDSKKDAQRCAGSPAHGRSPKTSCAR